MFNNNMNYPYITMINKFKNQFIIEGCSLNHNFKVIIYNNDLFDEYTINIQKTKKNIRPSILHFYELNIYYDIDYNTFMDIYKQIH